MLALCDSLLMEINRYNKINYDDGELFGIFIGINNYNGKKNLSLQFACNDAIELAEFFFGKIEKRSIYLLIDRTEVTNELITSAIIKTFEPTRSQIIDKVNFVRMNAKEQDKIIFFFAGHGNYYSNN